MEINAGYNGQDKEPFLVRIELTTKEIETLLKATGDTDIEKAIQKAVSSYITIQS